MTSFAYWQAQMPDGWFLCMSCFESFLIAEAFEDEGGQKWDVCKGCGE